MSTNLVIGVDIGGTKVLAGIVDGDGQVHEMIERPTVTTSQAALLEALADQVLSLPQDGIEAVGFGIPTRINHERGVALGSVNIPLDARSFEEFSEGALAGTPDRIRERIDDFDALGVEEIIISPASLPFALFDRSMIDLFAEAVVAPARAV